MAIYPKDPKRALDDLRRVNDFLVGVGPKATLTAVAHRMAGNEEAARTDLKEALRLVEDRLRGQPNDTLLLANKAEILALQGERAAADLLVPEIRQRMAAGDRSGLAVGDQSTNYEKLAYLLMLVNRLEEALTALESRFGTAETRYRTKVSLRYDPIWDPLRGNPRFEALLKAAEPKK